MEKAQSIAELKQVISNLEFQVDIYTSLTIKLHSTIYIVLQNQQLIKNSEEKDQLMNLEDTMSNLRQQVRRHPDSVATISTVLCFQTNNFQLPTPECTPIVEYKLFLPYK